MLACEFEPLDNHGAIAYRDMYVHISVVFDGTAPSPSRHVERLVSNKTLIFTTLFLVTFIRSKGASSSSDPG